MKERIRRVRARFHLTQKQLAEIMEVSTGFISLIETGRSGLSDENIEKLCQTLHLSASWLRDGIGEMESEHPADWKIAEEDEERRRQKADAIAGRVRELREVLHVSQRAFAAELGCSRELIALVEQRRSDASEALLKKIEQIYGISREWLREGLGEMRQKPEQASLKEETGSATTAEEENCVILDYLEKHPALRHALAEAIAAEMKLS